MIVACIDSLEEVERVKPLADLIEIRLDRFSIEKKPGVPVLFTLRKKGQGGLWEGSEEKRLEEIERYLAMGPKYFDIEVDTDPGFIEWVSRRYPGVSLIGSYHDFTKTPEDLESFFTGIQNRHFQSYKLSFYANSGLDMLRLMVFKKEAQKPLTAISMGPFGKPSRILGAVVGNRFCYAGLQGENTLARYSLKELHQVFRYRDLSPKTALYALIGDPVERSPGEIFHNPLLAPKGVYLKIRVAKEEFSPCFSLLKKLGVKGLSITMPHKEKAIFAVDALSEEAKAIGAINTVRFFRGKAIGSNTDGIGALNALEIKGSVKGKKIALLGTGGTARAIVYEAKKRGAIVEVFYRSEEKAKKFAIEHGVNICPLEGLEKASYQILISTLPPPGIALSRVDPKALFFDVNTRVATPDFPYENYFSHLLRFAHQEGFYPFTSSQILHRKSSFFHRKKSGSNSGVNHSPEVKGKAGFGEAMYIEQALLQQEEWKKSL